MPLSNLLNKIPKPGQLGAAQNGPRSIQKGKSFNKKLAVRGSLVIALVAGFFVLTTHADTNCRELSLAPFSTGECVQKLKVMVNKVSGSNLDVNNPAFDGPLNEQLIRMEAYNSFAPHNYNSERWVWMGVWDVLNQHYNEALERDAAAAQPPAPAETPAPAPAPALVPCREQNLTPFASGDCVKIIKALVNFVSGSNLDVNNAGFDGNLHQQLINMEKFNAFTPHHYTDKVTPEIYDKLIELRDAKQNAPPVVTPPPAATQAECKDQGLKVGSTGGCVRLLRASINVIYKQYHQQTPLKDGEKFDDQTSGTIKILVESGELGNNAKFRGYKGVVTADIWNDIMQVASQVNQATTGSTNPTTEPVTNETVDTNASPSVDGNCDTANMQRGSHGGCVRILHALLNKLGAGQVSAATDVFDDTTASVLNVTVNTYGLKGTNKGDYKGTVTPSIWNSLVAASNSKDQAKSIAGTVVSSVTNSVKNIFGGGDNNKQPVKCPATIEAFRALNDDQRSRLENKADCEKKWFLIAVQQSQAQSAGAKAASGAVNIAKTGATQAINNAKTTVANNNTEALKLLAQTAEELKKGDPDFIKNTYSAKWWVGYIDFDKGGQGVKLSVDPNSPMKYGYCPVYVYPDLTNTSRFWTYSSYYVGGEGVCTVKQQQSKEIVRIKSNARKEMLTVGPINTVTKANASQKALNGSYQ